MIYTCKLTAQISSCNKLSWQKVSEFVALTSFWCEITFPSLTCVSADLKYIDFFDALQQHRFGHWLLGGIFYDSHFHIWKHFLLKGDTSFHRNYKGSAQAHTWTRHGIWIRTQDSSTSIVSSLLLNISNLCSQSCSVGVPKKVWTICPNKEAVVMRLNKQLPINTIRVQIKIHPRIQIHLKPKDEWSRLTFYIVKTLTLIILL